MRQTSWHPTEDPAAPVDQVAVKTLRLRLAAVWREARAAARHERDVEAVHRLRVATRRGLAALDAFAELIPARRRRWFAKQLRRIRRAAGEARDLDVLATQLAQGAGEEGLAPTLSADEARLRLAALLSREQLTSRRPIRLWHEAMVEADWEGRVERLLQRVTCEPHVVSFGDYARHRFGPLVTPFFERAGGRLRTADELHRLRIEGKKLRYGLEIFAPVFPPETAARLREDLARLQKMLGEFTDHAAAADRLRAWSRSREPGADRSLLAALRREERDRARRARKVFTKWWNPRRRRALHRTFVRSFRQVVA